MAWTDEMTKPQAGALHGLLKWTVNDSMLKECVKYATENFNRKQASDELARIRDLYISHKLNKSNCFDSTNWDGFWGKTTLEVEEEKERQEALAKLRRVI